MSRTQELQTLETQCQSMIGEISTRQQGSASALASRCKDVTVPKLNMRHLRKLTGHLDKISALQWLASDILHIYVIGLFRL
jgi:hypothetical protein